MKQIWQANAFTNIEPQVDITHAKSLFAVADTQVSDFCDWEYQAMHNRFNKHYILSIVDELYSMICILTYILLYIYILTCCDRWWQGVLPV